MARESKTAEIDGYVFTVQQLPAMRSMKLMHKLAKAVGPAMLKALGSEFLNKMNLGVMQVGALSEGMQLLFEAFSETDLEQLVKTLFETAKLECEGQTFPMMAVFDEKLAGRLGTIMKAVKFALEVNYSDFFGGLLAGVAALSPVPLSKA